MAKMKNVNQLTASTVAVLELSTLQLDSTPELFTVVQKYEVHLEANQVGNECNNWEHIY
jgi:hypothetical protein